MSRWLLLALLLFSVTTKAIGIAEFQSQIENFNATFADAVARPETAYSRPLKVVLRPFTKGGEFPELKLSSDLTVLELKVPRSFIQSDAKFLVLLSVLAKALKYPLEHATRYASDLSESPIFSLLQKIPTEASTSFFHLAEMAVESNKNVKLSHRWQMAYLDATRDVGEHLVSQRFLEEQIRTVFPTFRLDREDVRKNGREASIQIMQLYPKSPWFTYYKFLSAMGSDELDSLIQRNDRQGVAKYIEHLLPTSMMTQKENELWRNQIEAIRNPDPSKKKILLRGGPLQSQNGNGYAARVLLERAEKNILKTNTLSWALARSSVLKLTYDHSFGTSHTFISTTFDPRTAVQFARRANVLTVLSIDSRRLIVPFFSQWATQHKLGESEILVPWIIFPDEITEKENADMADFLGEKYQADLNATEQFYNERKKIENFLAPVRSRFSCEEIF